ncbi:MAG: DUF5812 family protein [Halovenus sp.]
MTEEDSDSGTDEGSAARGGDTDDDLAAELYGVPADDGGTAGEGDGGTASMPNEPARMDEKTAPGTTATDSPDGQSDGPPDNMPFGAPPGSGDAGGSVPADAPISDEEAPPEPESGVFYVKYAEDAAATLHEVDTSQIYTVLQHPDFERHEIVEATLIAVPPMEVSYTLDELHSRRTVPVETSPEQPTTQVRDIAAEMEEGQAAAIDREGEGEIHILRVNPEWTERTVDELSDDEMTYKNAARYGMERVEIRADEDDGIVAIRYLP